MPPTGADKNYIPVIATDFGPYSFDRIPVLSKDGEVNLRGNCFLVETRKNKIQTWKTKKVYLS